MRLLTQHDFDIVFHWQTDKEEYGANSPFQYQHKNPK